MTAFDLIYLGATVSLSPFLTFKLLTDRRYQHMLHERLGLVASRSRARKCVWFHCASVGEVNAVKPVIQKLADRVDVAITTMTQAGRANALDSFRNARVAYVPADLTPCLNAAFSRLKPDLLVIVEQELWPNLILQAPCPVVLINGRITERSMSRYLRLGSMFRRVIEAFRLVCVQNETYAERYRRLGARPIAITGNLKFDAPTPTVATSETFDLIGGSTHAPEEEYLLEAKSRLERKHGPLRLVLAPRHLERLPEVFKLIELRRERCYKLSDFRTSPPPLDGVLVVDRMGELVRMYAQAKVVFVGGTFAPRGGQNIIEPASLGKPVVTGPSLHNFRDVAEALDAADALRVANSLDELVARLDSLLADAQGRRDMGNRARAIVRRGKGSTEVICRIIDRLVTAGR